ncbi:MAG: hypothetical protein C0392_00185 [Syntrophus sp. (in: bacteria)]|nr:hypothetical protein [Syntrophus sp. (in: bacteria)]
MKFRLAYIWFALPVVLIAIWVVVVYLPLSAKIKVKTGELANMKKESENIDNQIRVMVEARKKDEQIKASAEQLQMNIPLLNDFPQFVRGMVKAAGKDGIVIDRLSTRLETGDGNQASPMLNPVLEMNTRGSFMQVGKFLEDLQGKEAYRRISKARISYDEKEYPTLNAAVKIEFKVWRENIIENK